MNYEDYVKSGQYDDFTLKAIKTCCDNSSISEKDRNYIIHPEYNFDMISILTLGVQNNIRKSNLNKIINANLNNDQLRTINRILHTTLPFNKIHYVLNNNFSVRKMELISSVIDLNKVTEEFVSNIPLEKFSEYRISEIFSMYKNNNTINGKRALALLMDEKINDDFVYYIHETYTSCPEYLDIIRKINDINPLDRTKIGKLYNYIVENISVKDVSNVLDNIKKYYDNNPETILPANLIAMAFNNNLDINNIDAFEKYMLDYLVSNRFEHTVKLLCDFLRYNHLQLETFNIIFENHTDIIYLNMISDVLKRCSNKNLDKNKLILALIKKEYSGPEIEYIANMFSNFSTEAMDACINLDMSMDEIEKLYDSCEIHDASNLIFNDR